AKQAIRSTTSSSWLHIIPCGAGLISRQGEICPRGPCRITRPLQSAALPAQRDRTSASLLHWPSEGHRPESMPKEIDEESPLSTLLIRRQQTECVLRDANRLQGGDLR